VDAGGAGIHAISTHTERCEGPKALSSQKRSSQILT
jgi:hypothetical protein